MVETSTSSSHSLTPLTAPLSLQNIVTKRRRESVDIKLQSTNSEHVDDNVVDISNKFEKKTISNNFNRGVIRRGEHATRLGDLLVSL